MKGYQLLKKINKNKINLGTKFRIKHSDGNLDQDILIRYDLDENGFGALYTVDKVVDKSYICDSSIIINNDFYALKENKKRELLFIKSLKNAFIPSVNVITFILALLYFIFVNLNISLIYIIASLLFTVIIYLCTAILDFSISIDCKKNKFGQFNLDIDNKLKGKKYEEIIDFINLK